MQERPTPVIICSSLATKGAELSVQALAAGAVEIVTKPQLGLKEFLLEAKTQFWQAVAQPPVHVLRGVHRLQKPSKLQLIRRRI